MADLVLAQSEGFLASRFGSKRWLAASISISVTMLGMVTLVPGGIMFAVMYVVYGFVGTLGIAERSSLIANLTPSSQRGVGYALLFLPSSVIGTITPMITASLIDFFRMWRLFPISIGISTICFTILVLGIKED